MRLLITLLLIFVTCASFSQSRKKRKDSAPETQQQGPSSVDPGFPKEEYGPKKSKRKNSHGPTYESQSEYEDRMRATVKDKRKAEREMEKPQYSDPTYFGHKRKPKKRSPKNMRYCKECGIRH